MKRSTIHILLLLVGTGLPYGDHYNMAMADARSGENSRPDGRMLSIEKLIEDSSAAQQVQKSHNPIAAG